MSARAAAVEATRERILDVAYEAFLERWYDDVTLRDVAAGAGVALQTVVNHFGTKEALFGVVFERFGDQRQQTRYAVASGDVAGALETLVDDYDRTGQVMLRTLAMEERVPAVQPMIARGRQGHEDWVQHVFADSLKGLRGAARKRRVAQLVAVLDVYTWKLMRLDKGLSRDQTVLAMRELVDSLNNQTEGGSA